MAIFLFMCEFEEEERESREREEGSFGLLKKLGFLKVDDEAN